MNENRMGVLARMAVAVALLVAPPLRARGQEALDGAQLFRTHCGACHAVKPGRMAVMHGPNLAGIYGRAAGTLPNYPYSAGLAGASFAWDQAKLDVWLADPGAVVPGTTMRYAPPQPAVRRSIIEWLASLR